MERSVCAQPTEIATCSVLLLLDTSQEHIAGHIRCQVVNNSLIRTGKVISVPTTINVSNTLTITDNENAVTLDGNRSIRVFLVQSTGNLALGTLTVTNRLSKVSSILLFSREYRIHLRTILGCKCCRSI